MTTKKLSKIPTFAPPRAALYPKLTKHIHADVVVIGGGITGIMAAYFLTKAGKKVAVLESNNLGSGATAYTTAFITNVIDSPLSELVGIFGSVKAHSIWQSGADAIDMYEKIIHEERIRCEFKRCSAYIYAQSGDDMKKITEEYETARSFGFDVRLSTKNDLGFKNHGYLEIKHQALFDSIQFLYSLAKIVQKQGGIIFENSEVLDVRERPLRVTTKTGSVTAEWVMSATYEPFHNPKPTHFKKGMYKSYVVESRVPHNTVKEGMYWDCNNPYHYFRVDEAKEFDTIMLGGADHRLDIPVNEEKNFADLESYWGTLFDTIPFHKTRAWKGPILESVDGIPFIGLLKPQQFVAYAFSGNGITYAMIAGLMLRDRVMGQKNPWQNLYDPARTLPAQHLFTKAKDYIGEFFGGAVKNTIKY